MEDSQNKQGIERERTPQKLEKSEQFCVFEEKHGKCSRQKKCKFMHKNVISTINEATPIPKACKKESNNQQCRNPQCTQIHSNPKSVSFSRQTIPQHLQKGFLEKKQKQQFDKEQLQFEVLIQQDIANDYLIGNVMLQDKKIAEENYRYQYLSIFQKKVVLNSIKQEKHNNNQNNKFENQSQDLLVFNKSDQEQQIIQSYFLCDLQQWQFLFIILENLKEDQKLQNEIITINLNQIDRNNSIFDTNNLTKISISKQTNEDQIVGIQVFQSSQDEQVLVIGFKKQGLVLYSRQGEKQFGIDEKKGQLINNYIYNNQEIQVVQKIQNCYLYITYKDVSNDIHIKQLEFKQDAINCVDIKLSNSEEVSKVTNIINNGDLESENQTFFILQNNESISSFWALQNDKALIQLETPNHLQLQTIVSVNQWYGNMFLFGTSRIINKYCKQYNIQQVQIQRKSTVQIIEQEQQDQQQVNNISDQYEFNTKGRGYVCLKIPQNIQVIQLQQENAKNLDNYLLIVEGNIEKLQINKNIKINQEI